MALFLHNCLRACLMQFMVSLRSPKSQSGADRRCSSITICHSGDLILRSKGIGIALTRRFAEAYAGVNQELHPLDRNRSNNVYQVGRL